MSSEKATAAGATAGDTGTRRAADAAGSDATASTLGPTPVGLDATATDAGGSARQAAISTATIGPGTVLAHFRIDSLLGQGGMGQVYRATDLALDRPVAIKVLPADVAGDPGRRDRLVREARAQARIGHPNVCHIYFVGEQDGLVFFAMELVVGESLQQRLDRDRRLPADEAVELVRMAALGLREAQRHGFTHRDVKPSNLMLDAHGQVKVVDFGLVKHTGAAGDGDGERGGDLAATALVGTPLYMAPEQACGEPLDSRADVYALGATLHHLVSGQPPFVGGSAAEILSKQLTGTRPALTVPGRPKRTLSGIDAVCARMMARRPEDRFPGYDALITELDLVSPARTRPAGFWPRAFAGGIDLAVLGLLTVPIQLITEEGNGAFTALAMVYVIATVALWGASLGKAAFELQVVATATGRRPSWRQAAVRCGVLAGPLMVSMLIEMVFRVEGTPNWLDRLSAFFAFLGIAWISIELIRATVRRPDKRTVWDRVAGTLVRYRDPVRR